MARQRMTREQSREQTQQRLLDAAQTLFAKKGYAATSVEQLAAAAGYTRGAFYSNFASKSDLLFTLLRRDHATILLDLQRLFDLESSPQAIEQQILRYYSTLYADTRTFLLWTEARLHAARDAKFRARFNALKRESCDHVAGFIDRFAGRLSLSLVVPSRHLAIGLMALCDGVKFFHVADPQYVDGSTAESVLSAYFGAAFLGRRVTSP